MRILIVEDEVGLADALSAILVRKKYSVDAVYDGISGYEHALSGIYDAIILDVMLPKLNGFEVLKRIRSEKVQTPVLLLTAKSELDDKVFGLDSGADDYLTKPFETAELLARVRALMRRKGELSDHNLKYGNLILRRATYELYCNDSSVKLGMKEFQILELLMMNSTQIVTKEQITEKIWGYNDDAEYNNVEVYISFVRKKINFVGANVRIKATRNIGYSLEVLHDT